MFKKKKTKTPKLFLQLRRFLFVNQRGFKTLCGLFTSYFKEKEVLPAM